MEKQIAGSGRLTFASEKWRRDGLTMKDKRRRLTPVLHVALIGITAFCLIVPSASAKKSVPDKVVATVNGIPIYKRDVDAGLPKNLFGPTLRHMRTSRLDRLIHMTIIKQFLQQENIRIKEQRIDRQIEYLRKNPPTSGCSCCRYESLEKYMELNGMTMNDMRETIRVNMGLETYVNRIRQRKYSTEEKRLELVKEKRDELEMKYINVSHIFFNVFQDPQFQLKPDTVIKRKMKRAFAALKQLEDGEKFEKVAKEISEDAVTLNNGGALGCISKKLFGPEFARAATRLAPGQYSRPVQSLWGVHIIKRNAMTDKDILTILEQRFKEDIQAKTIKKLMDESRIVRHDKKMK
jgi:ABC-type dipeptide/oligopeptide/nickel transport system ATPase component